MTSFGNLEINDLRIGNIQVLSAYIGTINVWVAGGEETDTKTRITLVDGTTQEYDWSGEITKEMVQAVGKGNIAGVEIGTSVSSIGNTAFQSCSKLSSAVIPDSVTSIGNGAFQNCSKLGNVVIPDSVISIGNTAFENVGCQTVEIGSGLKTLGSAAFVSNPLLTSFIVNSANTSFKSENGMLLSKDGKTLVCGRNGSVVIPNAVERTEARSFGGFTNLVDVAIPSSLTSFGAETFSGTTHLSSISVDVANPTYAVDAEHNLVYTKSGTTMFMAGANATVAIPNEISAIGENTFIGQTNLLSISIPSGVKSIGRQAFYNCSNLSSAILAEGLTSIGINAFYSCTNLRNISIPSSVTSIGLNGLHHRNNGWDSVNFLGKTLAEVQAMSNYSWGVTPTSVISAELG